MIAPQACAGCGKDLATMQRRGQDWYCGVCGSTRPVTFRDRDGQP